MNADTLTNSYTAPGGAEGSGGRTALCGLHNCGAVQDLTIYSPHSHILAQTRKQVGHSRPFSHGSDAYGDPPCQRSPTGSHLLAHSQITPVNPGGHTEASSYHNVCLLYRNENIKRDEIRHAENLSKYCRKQRIQALPAKKTHKKKP